MDAPLKPVPSRGWLGWLARHPYTLLTLVFIAVASVLLVRQRSSEWDDVYVPAARRLLVGDDLFVLQGSFFYLPFSAVWAVPFTYLDALSARIAWVVLNMLAVVAVAWAAWRTAGGTCPEQAGTPWREHVILALGLLLSFRFVWNSLVHLQTDVVIAAMLMLGCFALVQGRGWIGAILLGISAAVKGTPLLFSAYFVWRRQWKLACAMVAVTGGLNLLPDLISSPVSGRLWAVEWVERCVKPLSQPGMYVGMWCTDPIWNQSLAGTAYRCLITEQDFTIGTGPRPHRADAMSPASLALIVRSTQATLLLGVLGVMILGRRSLTKSSSDVPGMHVATELSAVIAMMLLLSPMSGKAHFGILMLPAFCLTRQAIERRQPVLLGFLALAATLLLVTMKEVVGDALANAALWYGSFTGFALVLLGGCCYALLTSQSGASRTMIAELTPIHPASAAA